MAVSRGGRGRAGPPLPELSSVRNGSADSYRESSGGTGGGVRGGGVCWALPATAANHRAAGWTNQRRLTARPDVDLEFQTRSTGQVGMRRGCGGTHMCCHGNGLRETGSTHRCSSTRGRVGTRSPG